MDKEHFDYMSLEQKLNNLNERIKSLEDKDKPKKKGK